MYQTPHFSVQRICPLWKLHADSHGQTCRSMCCSHSLTYQSEKGHSDGVACEWAPLATSSWSSPVVMLAFMLIYKLPYLEFKIAWQWVDLKRLSRRPQKCVQASLTEAANQGPVQRKNKVGLHSTLRFVGATESKHQNRHCHLLRRIHAWNGSARFRKSDEVQQIFQAGVPLSKWIAMTIKN